jgi:hypothetical protein
MGNKISEEEMESIEIAKDEELMKEYWKRGLQKLIQAEMCFNMDFELSGYEKKAIKKLIEKEGEKVLEVMSIRDLYGLIWSQLEESNLKESWLPHVDISGIIETEVIEGNLRWFPVKMGSKRFLSFYTFLP